MKCNVHRQAKQLLQISKFEQQRNTCNCSNTLWFTVLFAFVKRMSFFHSEALIFIWVVFTKCWEHNITNGVSGWVRRVSTLGETVIQRTSCQTLHGKLQGRSYPHFNLGGRTYFLEYCWRTLHSFPVATNNFQLLPCRVLRILLVPNPMYRQTPSGSCSIVEMKT